VRPRHQGAGGGRAQLRRALGRVQAAHDLEGEQEGDLVGTLEMPMAVGLVGGAAKVHPAAKANVKILG